jgi:recombination protein RecA
VAVEKNIVEKSGSWYSYNGERIGQGRDNAKQFMRDHPETMAMLDGAVRKALELPPVAPSVPFPPPPAAEPPKAAARGSKG